MMYHNCMHCNLIIFRSPVRKCPFFFSFVCLYKELNWLNTYLLRWNEQSVSGGTVLSCNHFGKAFLLVFVSYSKSCGSPLSSSAEHPGFPDSATATVRLRPISLNGTCLSETFSRSVKLPYIFGEKVLRKSAFPVLRLAL